LGPFAQTYVGGPVHLNSPECFECGGVCGTGGGPVGDCAERFDHRAKPVQPGCEDGADVPAEQAVKFICPARCQRMYSTTLCIPLEHDGRQPAVWCAGRDQWDANHADYDATEVLKNANDFFDANAIYSGRVRCVWWPRGTGSLPAGAQLTGQNKPVGSADQAQTIKGDVAADHRDRGSEGQEGHPIEGLTAEGFHDHRRRRGAEDQLLRPPDVDGECDAAGGDSCWRRETSRSNNRLARTQIAPEAAARSLQGPPPAGAVLRYDDDAAAENQMRALEAAQKFIDADDGGGPGGYFAI